MHLLRQRFLYFNRQAHMIFPILIMNSLRKRLVLHPRISSSSWTWTKRSSRASHSSIPSMWLRCSPTWKHWYTSPHQFESHIQTLRLIHVVLCRANVVLTSTACLSLSNLLLSSWNSIFLKYAAICLMFTITKSFESDVFEKNNNLRWLTLKYYDSTSKTSRTLLCSCLDLLFICIPHSNNSVNKAICDLIKTLDCLNTWLWFKILALFGRTVFDLIWLNSLAFPFDFNQIIE